MVQVVVLKEEERKKAERKAEKKERKKEKKRSNFCVCRLCTMFHIVSNYLWRSV